MRRIIIILSIGLLFSGCGKKPTYAYLTQVDRKKTIEPKKDGKLHGTRKVYYGNGEIAHISSHINGRKDGLLIGYNLTGNQIYYETYKDDLLNGLKKTYHYKKKGEAKLESKVSYLNDRKTGKEVIYYKNGKLKSKISYTNGKKNNIAYYYDYRGRESSIIAYKEDKTDGLSTHWNYPYQKESTKEVTYYKENKKEGKSIGYYANGTVSSKVSYKNDDLDGQAIYFYKNGKISSIDNYKDGKLNGEKIIYKKDGTILEKLFYKQGEDMPTIILPKNAIAQYNLGLDYEEGKRGRHKDYKIAFKLYSKAANQGLVNAKNNLGSMYYHGRGTKVNKIKAYQLWYEAAQGSSEAAQINLNHLCNNSPWACKKYY